MQSISHIKVFSYSFLHLDELFIAFVMSMKAHAEIESIDTSEAEAQPGVVGFITPNDVKQNVFNGLQDYQLLPTGKVLWLLLSYNNEVCASRHIESYERFNYSRRL